MTSRELVYLTLSFERPERVPWQLWNLPWAEDNFPVELARVRQKFPDDLASVSGFSKAQPRTGGGRYDVGSYVDEWDDIDKIKTPDLILDIDGTK